MANIHISESSKMSRGEFIAALAAADHTQDYAEVRSHRTDRSLLREWAAHKLLYRLGLWKSHTESVDLNYPQAWYIRLAYFVFGTIALIIVK